MRRQCIQNARHPDGGDRKRSSNTPHTRLVIPRPIALQRARTQCVQIHSVTYMIFATPAMPQTIDCLCSHRPGMAHTPPFGTRLCCHALCDTMRHRTVVPHARDHFSAIHMARTHENFSGEITAPAGDPSRDGEGCELRHRGYVSHGRCEGVSEPRMPGTASWLTAIAMPRRD